MNRRNLIPHDRRRRRALRRATVRWAVAVSVLTVSAAATGLALSAILPAASADAAEADRTAAQANAARVAASAVRLQVAAARRALAAAHEVADQPDWSLLLADLSRRLGDDGVLGSCQMSTGTDPGVVTVRLAGLARSQPAATLLALRLERAGLFDRVDLLQTTPAQLMGKDAIAFQIACSIGSPAHAPGRAP
jgi:hypothetical protein